MRRLNESGMSLVEVIVALSVMIIGALAFTQMSTSQQKETKALSEKLAALDLQRLLLSTLNDEVCTFMLTDPSQGGNRSSNTFNSTALGSAAITFQNIPGSTSPTAPIVAQVGQAASAISSTAVVQSIRITGLTGTPDQFTGRFEVTLDYTKMARRINPVSVQITLQTDSASPATAKRIIACSLATSSGKPGTILARHSQTSSIPACPDDFEQLWSGYSFLAANGGGSYPAGMPDLGSSGSCMEEFRPIPVIECGSPNSCDFFTGGDYSYWLSSNASWTNEGGVSGAANILPKISRCSVCKSKSFATILVRHSQTTTVPSCPTGSNTLWTGYSFVSANGSPGYQAGQPDLSGPGSCLEEFRPIPMIECGGPNSCDYYTADDFSYWLSARTTWADEGGASGAGNLLPKISRCAVCSFKE